MTSPPVDEIEFVDAPTLRQLYARFGIERRIGSGELVGHVRRRTERPAPASSGEPRGTLSHVVVYVNAENRGVVVAHEYLRPNGTIGGSGQRDPKWLREGNKVWKL